MIFEVTIMAETILRPASGQSYAYVVSVVGEDRTTLNQCAAEPLHRGSDPAEPGAAGPVFC